MVQVVLVAPEIPPNTGNVARSCAATGTPLHLVDPLGFQLTDRYLKRAGLDYWERVNLTIWDDFDSLHSTLRPQPQEVAVFSKKGAKPFWSLPSSARLFLVFGSETQGLPPAILNMYANATYHIPITTDIRSLNLSTAVGIALYESLRFENPFHGWSVD